MSRTGRLGLVVLAAGLGLVGARLSRAADVPSRTLAAPVDRVWTATDSALKRLGWEIEQSDRAVGWLVTAPRDLDFKDYAVYGKGLRHKLRIAMKAVGEGRTTVSVEREVYAEERILWMIERTPVAAPDRTVETGILDAIEQALLGARPVPTSAPV
ncbi:MAG TPA: hypothetical protein VIE44_08050 [Methylomirabilota bacterium]